MVTDKDVKKALSKAIKKAHEHNDAQENFDRIASEFFNIDSDDFREIYQKYDELVDPVVYGDGKITWSRLCKIVNEYKEELRREIE